MNIEESFEKLKSYCEQHDFCGYDPYDGLNSKLFQNLPFFPKNAFFRLVWIQLFKRNPLNFRKLALIKKEYNPKGLGLFLSGYCNLYRINPKPEYLEKINYLATKLIDLQSKNYSGSCWGYNFDWQAKAFFQPRSTPTVVATSFNSHFLIQAYEITKNQIYLDKALSSTNFVLNDLNRSYDEDGDFAFSYSPLDQTQVFNASLLGVRTLAQNYFYTQDETLLPLIQKAVAYCVKQQNPNGSWAYSPLKFHQWIDNFHTGYNLECLADIQGFTGDNSFVESIEKGLEYYLKTFFTTEGKSKYYSNSLYPIDVHCPAQLIVTLSKLNCFDKYKILIDKVLDWTIQNMQSKEGYFYYQQNKYFTNKIPYMRWTQAWAFYGLSTYLLHSGNKY